MRSLILPVIATAYLGFALPSMAQPSSVAQSNVQAKSRSYIGLRYRDVPKGLTDLGGWVIGFEANGTFRHAVARIQDGNREMLWLERFLGHDRATGKAFFEVVDVLNLPTIPKSQTLSSFCWRNGKRDPDIIAIARMTETEYWTNITRAWRTNRTKEKFEAISLKGIRCENTGWGV